MAKKYCYDVTSKLASNSPRAVLPSDGMMFLQPQPKQNEPQVVQMVALQEAANKQRALLLMSRIYVGSINFELGEDTIRQAFQPFGSIKAINMSWDSATMKHKGYSFVEYETPEAAQLALEQMNGVVIGGRNIKVGRPNNVPQAAPIIAQIQEEATKFSRIYVSSIHGDLTDKDVKSVFEAFGHIVSIDLAPDNVPGRHRGWGYVEYDNSKSAADAIASMNLFDLGGQFLRVGRALTPPMPLYPPNAGPVLPGILTTPVVNPIVTAAAAAARINAQVSALPALKEERSPLAPNNLVDIQAKLAAVNEEKMKSEDVMTLQQEENVSISGSNARLMIMKKLSRKQESRVIVLRNMVDASELDEELEDEVTSECSKYGSVDRVVIYQEKQGTEDDADIIVKIFVTFKSSSEAEAAVKSLDGRWFGGKMIKAEVYDEAKFDNNDLSH